MNLAAFMGVPYDGRHFCRVLAGRVLDAHGIPWPRVSDPAKARDWQRVAQPRALDVVVFNRAGRPGHVGVCIGRGRFLHVEEGARSVIEYLASPLWQSRVEGYYRYTGERACN